MSPFDINFDRPPYQAQKREKDETLTRQLLMLTQYHRERCGQYDGILSAYRYDDEKVTHYSELPFLPSGLFKRLTLSSISEEESGLKTVTSSGTTGQQVSKIVLDGETRTLQQRALVSIGNDFIGKQRIPMLVIDCEKTAKGKTHFSARTSAVLGFSLFGKNRSFALDDRMELDIPAIERFVELYGRERFLIFGFTYLIWSCVCLELETRGLHMDLSNAILIHGGGWKKLQAENITREQFREKLYKTCNITRVHDYYGMAEQTGSIFMECEYGHMHCSDYSGVLLRRAKDFTLCEKGEAGLIQTLSVLPLSYPGHNILTEDEGVLLGEDDCKCGRKGVYFKVLGRTRHAEIRGCSDTYEESGEN